LNIFSTQKVEIDDFKNLVDKIKNMKIKLEQMRDESPAKNFFAGNVEC
jgi:hypothetical protein